MRRLPVVLLLSLLFAAPAGADTDAAPPPVLAPGYGPLNYEAPEPGTYALPALGVAADGEVLLAGGKATRLHALYGKKLALLSFIYTRCSDVNGCPLATMVLSQVSSRLNEEPALRGALQMISLSFDPEYDTPEHLEEHGRMFSKHGNWQFATTESDAALQPILAAYGQDVQKEYNASGEPNGKMAHNLRVFLIDAEKRIRNIYSVGFLHADILVNDAKTILAASQNERTLLGPGDGKMGYESASYVTRSASVPDRVGTPADLLAFAERTQPGLPPVPVPADNRLTREKIALGRKLFFDRRLSLNDTQSCAMCHIAEQGFAHNELATAVGIEGRTVRRNAPTLLNVAYMTRLFHDGRENRLETQVWQPMLSHNEMANPSIGAVLQKLESLPDYSGLFEAAFDGRGPGMESVGMALASYQRTLIAGDSPFDRWHYSGDEAAVSAAAKRGFDLFSGPAGCAGCHSVGDTNALFTDNAMHNTGVGWYASMRPEPPSRKVQLAPGVFVEVKTEDFAAVAEPAPSDLGLYEITQDPADRWRYRTPSLRNVALTSPYMHDGSFGTLREVVEYYKHGGHAHELLDPRVRPLRLSDGDVDDLVAFLLSLTGAKVDTLVMDAMAAPIGDLRAVDPHWSHRN